MVPSENLPKKVRKTLKVSRGAVGSDSAVVHGSAHLQTYTKLIDLFVWANTRGLFMYHGVWEPPAFETKVRHEYWLSVMFLGSMSVTVMFQAQVLTDVETLAPGCHGPVGIPLESVCL